MNGPDDDGRGPIHCDRCLREVADRGRLGGRCNGPVGVSRHCHGRFVEGPAPDTAALADMNRPLFNSDADVDNTTRP